MKPYQTAWDVAKYMRTNKNYYKRPININAITEYFKGGLIRELNKIKGSSYLDQDIAEDAFTWAIQLRTWLNCWYTWICAE